ncbi:hypothetical protein [Corynebacterium striatum]|uniref:hypothetical protein n=1 Tax=Corynebacterium striatum TaxID=43770 RepID=UPI000C1CCBC2|nr:hypothetical protein [Corynebacterium striatum]PIS60515.1 hypothetical protein AZH45_10260 [Corynebacterium striatum]PIS63370.1 hypothetical protein AZH47_04815 [Corynebacterium striatum]PIS65028.1 hypothetical protein AZH44_01815 [Corynebacterium striatum]PIS66783.1 hypothetical protein AZH46_10930 [Corynebacterium striatum]PXY06636.1 hypothetical protein CKF53_05025 [Corynebacterium striatum]
MEVSTDLSVLMTEKEWNEILDGMPEQLDANGYEPANISAEVVSFTCEPDNVLVNEYMDKHGSAPVSENVWRVIVNGTSTLPLTKVTAAVVDCLPPHILWYGTSEIGHTEFGLGTACAWQP